MAAWEGKALKYLRGDYSWGEQHIIRPIPVPTEEMPDQPEVDLDGDTPLSFTGCGPRPWSEGVMVAVSVLRAYFCREFKNCGMYSGYEGRHPYLIFMPDDVRRWVVGGMDFEYFDGKPHLCWAYLHPEFRGEGVMTSAVEAAHLDVGDFTTEKPIAPAMLRVLAKIGHPDQHWKPEEGEDTL